MTSSVVSKAVQDKYTTLTFAGKPPLFYDRAPVNSAGTAAATLPYVVLSVREMGTMEWMADLSAVEATQVVFTIYATSKNEAKTIALGIAYDGSPKINRQGMDDGILTFPSGYDLNKIERTTSGMIDEENERGTSANLVFRAVMTYTVEVLTS